MSQEYTPVEWTDETPTEPGTLINKARLDQMQSAHHYADGFEEVDTIPTADPGVDYHKVVYCTADSTFYRWDGSQWTKDVDDETKALLLAHEADHSNPHVVTKAQVGLGDVVDKPMDDAPTDSSDNYVKSGGVKTALDGKLDIIPTTAGTYFYAQQSTGPTRYAGTSNAQTGTTTVVLRDATGRFSVEDPTGASNAANKRYVDGKLTDGSVTKVGTADVGSDLKPIKLVAGVPTAVTNDLVDTATAQTINADKVLSFNAATSAANNTPKGTIEKLGNIAVNSTTANRYFYLAGARDSADKLLAGINMRYNANGDVHFALATTDSNDSGTAQEIARFYRSTNTWGSVLVSDALDNYATMVRTTGNQTKAGILTLNDGYAGQPNDWHGCTATGQAQGQWSIFAKITCSSVGAYHVFEFIQSSNTASTYGKLIVHENKTSPTPAWIVRRGNGSNNPLGNVSDVVVLSDGTDLYLAWRKTPPYGGLLVRQSNEVDYGGVRTLANGKVTYYAAGSMTILNDLTGYTATTPTDITDNMVTTDTAQTISGAKTFTNNPTISKGTPALTFKDGVDIWNSAPAGNRYWGVNFQDKNGDTAGSIGLGHYTNGNKDLFISNKGQDGTIREMHLAVASDGTGYITGPNRAYNASNTTDIVNIALLDGYTPMLRTSGTQTFTGVKKGSGSGVYRKLSTLSTAAEPPSGSTTEEILGLEPSNGGSIVQLFNSETKDAQCILNLSTKHIFKDDDNTIKTTQATLWLTAYKDKAVLFLRGTDKSGNTTSIALGQVTF